MDDKIYKVSDRVTVVFEVSPLGFYYPKIVADGESMKIPLIFYPEMMGVEPWLKALEGLDEPLKLAYNVVAGALMYAQKYPN